MKRHLILSLLLSLAMLVPGMFLYSKADAQSTSAVIRFDPQTLGMTPGSQGSVSILVENVADLYGLEFHLSFDPQIAEVVDADPAKDGIQITPANAWQGGFIAVNHADNVSGKIDFAVTLLNPVQPLSGKLTIATITFQAKNPGTSNLNIESAILSTIDAQEIEYTSQNGAFAVNAKGEAPVIESTAPVKNTSTGVSMVTLAILAVVVLLLAIGVFIYVIRRKA
jgi:hypothetical protein